MIVFVSCNGNIIATGILYVCWLVSNLSLLFSSFILNYLRNAIEMLSQFSVDIHTTFNVCRFVSFLLLFLLVFFFVTNQTVTRTFHFIALTLSNLTLIASGRAAARCWMRVGAFCGTVIRNCVSVQNEKER